MQNKKVNLLFILNIFIKITQNSKTLKITKSEFVFINKISVNIKTARRVKTKLFFSFKKEIAFLTSLCRIVFSKTLCINKVYYNKQSMLLCKSTTNYKFILAK